MDVVLVEGNSGHARRLLSSLQTYGHRIVRLAETPIANGVFWPPHALTHAILLGFDAPSPEKIRVLKRLWASECGLPSFIVTSAGSHGEALLAGIAGPATSGGAGVHSEAAPDSRPGNGKRAQGNAPRASFRAAHTLPLEKIIALERVVARLSAAQG